MRRLVEVSVVMALVGVVGCKAEPTTVDETIESGSSRSAEVSGIGAALGTDLARDGGGGSGSGSGAASGSGSGGGSGAGSGGGSGAGSARPTVAVPPEIAAIQLTLVPNWDRDVVAAGTISRHVEVLSRGEQATFVVHYGYDAPGAPTNRVAYKAFLGEQKLLTVARDRQLGGAWYLEGSDAAGKAAFRFLVSYGGKRLVCFGSLYRESSLGDIRDQVMNEAKSICETIQL